MRSSFWQARKFVSLEDLNEQALKWCMREAGERRWVQDEKLSVLQAFEQEKANLLKVPESPLMVYDRQEVSVGKTTYVRFDCNDYSIPAEHVRKTLSVFATLDTVKICDGNKEVARHKRSFAKGKQIEDQSHLQELIDAKRAARKHRAMDRLQLAAPSTTELLCQAGGRGHNLGRLTQQLTSLLDLYGASELEAAVKDALAGGAVHASAVKQALETRRSKRGARPAVRLHFEGNPKANEVTVTPKSLHIYDSLLRGGDENND